MTAEERLEVVEGELHKMKMRGFLLAIGLLCSGLLSVFLWSMGGRNPTYASENPHGALPPPAPVGSNDVIKAAGFVLVDEQGRERGELSMNEDGEATLSLHNEQGKIRAGLGVTEDGPGLLLFDEQGKPRAGLAVTEYGVAMLRLLDERGELRAGLECERKRAGVEPARRTGQDTRRAGRERGRRGGATPA